MEETQKTARGGKKDFPLTTLIVAENVARAVSNAGGKIKSTSISASLGNIKGGALARKIAAAKRWGLIKGVGMLELTNLGKKIIIYANDEELAKSRKEAFLTAPLFNSLYERFGAKIPSDQAFVAILANEYELTERDAKTILNSYKEAIKFYLDANNSNGKGNQILKEEQSKVKPPKKDGKLSIYISSPMGENNFKADNKIEFGTMKKRLNSLFTLIEEEFPDDSQTGPKAEGPKPNLSSEEPRDNSEITN